MGIEIVAMRITGKNFLSIIPFWWGEVLDGFIFHFLIFYMIPDGDDKILTSAWHKQF
jgi:hypothetical protein